MFLKALIQASLHLWWRNPQFFVDGRFPQIIGLILAEWATGGTFPAVLGTSSILNADRGLRESHEHLIIISLQVIVPSNSVWVGKYWKYYNVLSALAEIIYLKSGCSVELVFIRWIIHSRVILSPWQVSTTFTPPQVSLHSHLGAVQKVVSGFSVKMGSGWTRNEPHALCQLNNLSRRPIYAYRSLDAVRLLITSTCRAAQHQLCTCIILDQSAVDCMRTWAGSFSHSLYFKLGLMNVTSEVTWILCKLLFNFQHTDRGVLIFHNGSCQAKIR